MPDKIWVHKDTKYNTTEEVFGYQYEFAQEIQDEGIENFVEYVNKDCFIDKAVEWLKDCLDNGMWIATDVGEREKAVIIEHLKQFLEEQIWMKIT